MPSHVVLPNTVKTFVCQVPGCSCGGEHFLNERAFVRHVTKEARRHRESILAASDEHAAAIEADPFQKVHDPEALEFVLRNGGYKKKR